MSQHQYMVLCTVGVCLLFFVFPPAANQPTQSVNLWDRKMKPYAELPKTAVP